MKRAEFIECCKMAADTFTDLPGYLSEPVVDLFDTLNKGLRAITTKQVFAGAIRGQAMAMAGELIQSEVQMMEGLSRRVDLIG